MALAALLIAILALAIAVLGCLANIGVGVQQRQHELESAKLNDDTAKAVNGIVGLLQFILGELDKQNAAKLNAIEERHVSGGH